eukprot:NODE_1576_length_822_cov_6.182406_g1315_i0.p2 GENE.NODE_1576_length_822_cov_6.182406_g1315_i0~~NODE_1576_length_822_cov_6.182406_g1315_i0.p2  ORF type:complete len:229 (+),score=85.05 NODE_1576_length_822_cov_6.182406_g1315_i0:118-804(+)
MVHFNGPETKVQVHDGTPRPEDETEDSRILFVTAAFQLSAQTDNLLQQAMASFIQEASAILQSGGAHGSVREATKYLKALDVKLPDRFPGFSLMQDMVVRLSAACHDAYYNTMEGIRGWLANHDLLEHLATFSRNHMTPSLIGSLTHSDLQSMGVVSFPQRKAILQAVAAGDHAAYFPTATLPPEDVVNFFGALQNRLQFVAEPDKEQVAGFINVVVYTSPDNGLPSA